MYVPGSTEPTEIPECICSLNIPEIQQASYDFDNYDNQRITRKQYGNRSLIVVAPVFSWNALVMSHNVCNSRYVKHIELSMCFGPGNV